MAVKKKKGNLTQKPGCYSYELNKHVETIMKIVLRDDISLNCMKNYILHIIEPANIDKDAKPRFIANLKKAPSKKQVARLVLDAIANGKKVICDLD